MADQPHLRPFTFALSYALAGIVFLSLVANMVFASGCISASRGSGEACKVSAAVTTVAGAIPAVRRAVVSLEDQGDPQRAAMVGNILAFVWASTIATALAMAAATALRLALLGRDEKADFRRCVDQQRRPGAPPQQAQLAGLGLVLALLFFVDAFSGNFMLARVGGQWSTDTQLYGACVCLAVFLFFLIIPLVVAAGAIALRTGAETPVGPTAS